jgi:hypothetical protein
MPKCVFAGNPRSEGFVLCSMKSSQSRAGIGEFPLEGLCLGCDLVDSSGLTVHKTLDIWAAIWSTSDRQQSELEPMTPPRQFAF